MSTGCRPRRRISEVVGKAKAGGGSTTVAREEPPVEGPAGMMRPHEVDAAWRALLEETLTPDKRDALMETYEAESDPKMRYTMLLEFSSYLRQGAATMDGRQYDDVDEKYKPPAFKQGLPRQPDYVHEMRGFQDDDDNLCWEILRVIFIVGAILGGVVFLAYYLIEPEAPGADLQYKGPMPNFEAAGAAVENDDDAGE